MGRTYKTEGIVLKRINYSEADKIITIFTKHYGKIKCLAKGIRKLTSRRGGNLELFNLVVLFLVKGKNLDLVTEAQVVDSFAGFRQDLKRVAIAYQLNELVDRFTRENQANWHVFELLKDSFKKLTQPKIDLKKVVVDFKIKLLKYTGFGLPTEITEESLNSHIEKIIEKRVKSFYDQFNE